MSDRIASVFSVDSVKDTDDAVTIITKLRLQVQFLEERLAQVQAWGNTGWKRWSILTRAVQDAEAVRQEPT